MSFKARKGYGPNVGNSLIPLSQPEPRVDAGAGLKMIAKGLGDFDQGIKDMQKDKEDLAEAELLSDLSNTEFELNRSLEALRDNAPIENTEHYENAETLISQTQRDLMERIPEKHRARFFPMITGIANKYRAGALQTDKVRKNVYFDFKLDEVINKEGLKVEGNPSLLQEAETMVEAMMNSFGQGAVEKTTKLRNAKLKLKKIAYGKLVKTELGRTVAGSASIIEATLPRLFRQESGGEKDPNKAKNPNSSAYGKAQAIKSTWLKYMRINHGAALKEFGPKESLKLRENPAVAEDFARWYLTEIAGTLSRNGEPINPGTLYLGYFLGEGGAIRLLNAPANDPASLHMSAAAVKANASVVKGKTVAEMQQWAAKAMGQTAISNVIDNDPQFAGLDYETRIQLRNDAKRSAKAEATAEKAKQKAVFDEKFNNLLNGMHDGLYGQADIDSAISSGWLTEFDDIKKAEKALKDRDKDMEDIIGYHNKIAQGSVWNSADSDHQKYLNAHAKQAIIPFINEQNPAASPALSRAIDSAGGSMAPSDAMSTLEDMTLNNDWNKSRFAYQVLLDQQRLYGEVINKHLDDKVINRLALFDARNGSYDEQTMAMLMNHGLTQEMRQFKEQATVEARALIDELDLPERLTELFDPLIGIKPVVEPFAMSKLRAEWEQAYIDSYIISRGLEPDAATKGADNVVLKKWGPTRVGGPPGFFYGVNGRVVKYPPEKAYPGIPSTYLHDDVVETYGLKEGDTYELIPDAITDAEASQKRPLSYGVVVYREDGTQEIHNGNPVNGTQRISFATQEVERTGKDGNPYVEKIGPAINFRNDEENAMENFETSSDLLEGFGETLYENTEKYVPGLELAPEKVQEKTKARAARKKVRLKRELDSKVDRIRKRGGKRYYYDKDNNLLFTKPVKGSK